MISYDKTFFDWFCLLFSTGDRMETSEKELFDQIFGPPKSREGHKKWFGIVHWVVMNVFEPSNPFRMMYLKLGLT